MMVTEQRTSRDSTATGTAELVGFVAEQTLEEPTLNMRPATQSGGRNARVLITHAPSAGKTRVFITKHAGELPSSTYTPSDAAPLERQLTYLQARSDGLEAGIRELQQDRDRALAHVAGDEVALFILAKVVQAGVLGVSTLTENLTAPHGWLAFAQLTRAMLVDCIGDEVVPTEAGRRLLLTILGDTFSTLSVEGE